MSALIRFLADRRGTSAVEFALVIVPFLMLVFGTIETGRAFWTRQALADMAIMGARCMGVVQHECADENGYAPTKARDFIVGGLKARGVTVADENIILSHDAECDGLPGFSMVSISTSFSSALPLDDVLDFSGVACFPNQRVDD